MKFGSDKTHTHTHTHTHDPNVSCYPPPTTRPDTWKNSSLVFAYGSDSGSMRCRLFNHRVYHTDAPLLVKTKPMPKMHWDLHMGFFFFFHAYHAIWEFTAHFFFFMSGKKDVHFFFFLSKFTQSFPRLFHRCRFPSELNRYISLCCVTGWSELITDLSVST